MLRIFLIVISLFAGSVFAQEHAGHVTQDGATRAAGVWLPTEPGQCTKEMHDRYTFTDPDSGEVTTVAHAETDSTGCRYDHGHVGEFALHIPTVIPDPIKNSMAMGLWKPSTDTFLHPNECTQEEHDSYKIVYQGKYYPTWHPPQHVRFSEIPAVIASDGITVQEPAIPAVLCNFGHEHRDNPALSPIYDPNFPVCFGCVNELMMTGPRMMRHEDHVGHKIEVVTQAFKLRNSTETVTCHTITKLHQGTHSPDALTSSLHEFNKQFKCDKDDSYFRIQGMAAIGRGGYIEQNGNSTQDIYVGPPTPADSPMVNNALIDGKSLGDRDMPTNVTVYVAKPNLFEQWRFQFCAMGVGGNYCAARNADYWSISNPSRHYDPAKPNKMGRPLDACWMTKEDGTWVVDAGTTRYPSVCGRIRANNVTDYRDIRSINGTIGGLRQDNFSLSNCRGGPAVFYTDPLGYNSVAEPNDVSKVRQEVVGCYPDRWIETGSPTSKDQVHANIGVHAPN